MHLNIVDLYVERWVEDAYFTADIIVNSFKASPMKSSAVNSYTGMYYYEIKGKKFSQKIAGTIPEAPNGPPEKSIPIKPREMPPAKPNETISVQPKEKIAAVLIRKYPAPPEIERFPDRFINYWITLINSVRTDGPKPNLQKVIQKNGRLLSAGPSMKELAAEATFTLRCLASEGYVQIKDSPAQGGLHGVGFDNLEFEFVPEKLNEFIEGL